jgi:anti-sigma factor ChrR (cupin superfamily)
MTRRKGERENAQDELEALRSMVRKFVDWPAEVLRPPDSVWDKLAQKLKDEGAGEPQPRASSWSEPDWEEAAPGISYKLLATDREHDRVTMLVRLAPGVAYPPHVHAGIEELHLLDGELWIGDRKLLPGDYNLGERGASDHRVWSETGCTCVLITSPSDKLL